MLAVGSSQTFLYLKQHQNQEPRFDTPLLLFDVRPGALTAKFQAIPSLQTAQSHSQAVIRLDILGSHPFQTSPYNVCHRQGCPWNTHFLNAE